MLFCSFLDPLYFFTYTFLKQRVLIVTEEIPSEDLDRMLSRAARSFMIFIKPSGSLCNLHCSYCYYLEKKELYPDMESFRMPEALLEEYIIQHINASPEKTVRFSWHGGEPTVLGLDFFRMAVSLQKKHRPAGYHIANGMQTNGTLLDENWGRFLAKEGFYVGLSLDGPKEFHDIHRRTKKGKSSFEKTMHGYEILKKHGVSRDILCVVHNDNVKYPERVYHFFKDIEASYITFLPLVERSPETERGISERTVPSEAWGEFLCTVFDEWVSRDIGWIKVQIFEEAARTAFGQEHSLCIFRPTCGDVPVIEHNGDFYSCDHFVDPGHRLGNIQKTPLVELLESPAQRAFGLAKLKTLPRACLECDVREMCNGGCPKNRFLKTADGEENLNYLCSGYKSFFQHCRPWVEEVGVQWRKTKND
ncbi:MAG: anaerobic sulfatase maturase [Candidatus Aminicenantes bacterium]|nr:anaerobic sulfatase maturase [Candidatus Aminicenantes bacterium]